MLPSGVWPLQVVSVRKCIFFSFRNIINLGFQIVDIGLIKAIVILHRSS